MKATRKRRAFTVLELTIATLILLVALLVSARLLQDTAAQIAWSGRKAVEISPEQAIEQIRTDLRQASGVFYLGSLWTSGPLVIAGSSSGLSIVYEIDESGTLVRGTEDKDGFATERRVLDRVVDLRYRSYYGAIEVEVTFLRMSPLLRKDTAAGAREALSPEQRQVSFIVHPRRVMAERF